MDMAWPFVSWIMSSSSSSSSSSTEFGNDGDADDDSDYDEAESPNDDVSCNGDDAAAVDSVSPSTQSPCQPITAVPAVEDTNPSSSTSKRRRPDSDEAVKIRAPSKRVWTKEDELELLHGFLEHRKRHRIILENGRRQKENYVSSFYNEVKPELQQRFNRGQVVEKLRRLRRKYNQNVANYKKINSSLDNTDQFCFKNSHDKTTFEISHEIWNSGGAEDQTIVDDNVVSKRTRSQTRSEWLKNTRRVLKINDEGSETTGLIMGLALNYPIGLMKFGDGDHHDQVMINNDVKDEKWREQQIMELEVYLKRLELVQAQVKAALDKLRSSGG